MSEAISIVTAFFDIGRGELSIDQGHPEHLHRTNDQYFKYFSYLARLENEMVVFTTKEYKQKILDLRRGKKTEIVILDLQENFKEYLDKIRAIQQSQSFQAKINPKQLKNIEYWSPEYVLIMNLKVYFIERAIRQNLVHSNTVAWLDFGYCRTEEDLANVKEWCYDFSPNKVHVFVINKIYRVRKEADVLHAIFNNKTYITGGSLVADVNTWKRFYPILKKCQDELLEKGIIDDDQGVFLMCRYKHPTLFLVHYVGKQQWRTIFRRYDRYSKLTFIQKIRKLFGLW